MGVPIPNAWLGGIKNIDLVKEFGADKGFWKTFSDGVENLTEILNAANFQKINKTDLEEALKEESLFKIRLRVDFTDFGEVLFYQRGESTKKETLVRFFGLKKEPITFTNYERVVIYIKFKEEDYFRAKRHKNLYFTPGSTIIKLFQNVPKAVSRCFFPTARFA